MSHACCDSVLLIFNKLTLSHIVLLLFITEKYILSTYVCLFVSVCTSVQDVVLLPDNSKGMHISLTFS